VRGGPPAPPLAEWRVGSAPRWFTQWIDVPAGRVSGSGSSPYATLEVTVATEGGGAPVSLGLEQFDAAPIDETIAALKSGWNEPEEDPATGKQWRWASEQSAIEVRGPVRDRMLELAGEVPLEELGGAPVVTVRAGDRVLGSFTAGRLFHQTVALPGDAIAAAQGVVIIQTDRWYSPSQQGSKDVRHLALQLATFKVSDQPGLASAPRPSATSQSAN
jgi:hypothetical protein